MDSFPKHTILKQISIFTFLNCSIPLWRHDLIRSIANSGLTSFICLAWLPSSSYLPCSFPWEDPNSTNLPGRFPGGTGNSYFPVYDNHTNFQSMTHYWECFILVSGVSSLMPVQILHGCLSPRGVQTQLLLLGNIYTQFYRAVLPQSFPNSGTRGKTIPISSLRSLTFSGLRAVASQSLHSEGVVKWKCFSCLFLDTFNLASSISCSLSYLPTLCAKILVILLKKMFPFAP